MPRYTAPYTKLVLRLSEINTICNLATRLEKETPIGKWQDEVEAMCRGGVVLLSSHLEGYITDLNSVILTAISNPHIPLNSFPDELIFHQVRDIFEQLKNTNDKTKIGQKFRSLHHREKYFFDAIEGIDPSPRLFNNEIAMQSFSTPKPSKIYKFFKRYGYDCLRGDIAKTLKTSMLTHENLVLRTVQIRNDIAHGDDETKETPADLRLRLNSVRLYCRVLDDSVANFFKNKSIIIRTIDL